MLKELVKGLTKMLFLFFVYDPTFKFIFGSENLQKINDVYNIGYNHWTYPCMLEYQLFIT